MKNKATKVHTIINRSGIAFLLCLALFASLCAVPAFADGGFVVIGGSVASESASSQGTQPTQTAVVVSEGGTEGAGSASVSGSGSAAAQTAGSGSGASVVIMPDGTVQSVGQSTSAPAALVTEAASVSAPAVTAANAPTALAAQIISLVNLARREKGLNSVSYSAALQSIADLRARESATRFDHTRPDGSHCSTAVTVDYRVTGENLIQVTTALATAEILMDTWLNSPSHCYNILLPEFTNIAVGSYVQNDTTYVSMIFIG